MIHEDPHSNVIVGDNPFFEEEEDDYSIIGELNAEVISPSLEKYRKLRKGQV